MLQPIGNTNNRRFRAPNCDYIFYFYTGQLVKVTVEAIVTIGVYQTVTEAEQAIKEDMKNDKS